MLFIKWAWSRFRKCSETPVNALINSHQHFPTLTRMEIVCNTLAPQIKGILYILDITLWSGHYFYDTLWLGHYFSLWLGRYFYNALWSSTILLFV